MQLLSIAFWPFDRYELPIGKLASNAEHIRAEVNSDDATRLSNRIGSGAGENMPALVRARRRGIRSSIMSDFSTFRLSRKTDPLTAIPSKYPFWQSAPNWEKVENADRSGNSSSLPPGRRGGAYSPALNQARYQTQAANLDAQDGAGGEQYRRYKNNRSFCEEKDAAMCPGVWPGGKIPALAAFWSSFPVV